MSDEKLPPPSPERQQELLDRDRMSRRTWMVKIGFLLNGAIALLIATPIVRYLLAPLRGKDGYRTWIELGGTEQFKEGETRLITYRNPFTNPWDGDTDKVSAYVRRASGDDFTVFAVNCAHLNCPVRWFSESQLFMCPCHGGVYYANGERASGPPERGLFKYEVKISGGKLMIKAGQMPTLSNRAQLIQEIGPCRGTDGSTTG